MAIILGQANATELVSLRLAGIPTQFADGKLRNLFESTRQLPLPQHERAVLIGTPDRIADLIFASAPLVVDRALAMRPQI